MHRNDFENRAKAEAENGDCTKRASPRARRDCPRFLHGGNVASYKIERRERPEGAWSIAGMAIESKITLHNQERGKEWEYRVIAVNRAGEGIPSNTVMAVL